jgi:iron complex transport system substrate-binding protein
MRRVSRRRFLAAMAVGVCAPAGVLHAGAKRTITDDAGRQIAIPEKVERVYAAGPPASILAYALAPEKLLGWTTSFRPAERPYVPEKYADLPTLGRLTGRGNTANVEVVLAAKPDLIIDYGSIRPTFASLADRVQDQTGIPYILLDGAFDRIPDSLRSVGDILDEPARGEEWARYAKTMLDDIGARVSKIPPAKRARVYYGRGPTGLVTGLSGSINVEALERIGAINVASELGRGGLVQISIEQALSWNPDIIVTTDPNFYTTAQVLPLWSALPAVSNGRLYLAPAVPFGWIDFPPSINRLLGLYWLGKVIYPELFPEDLRSRVREFYTRAYHRAPSDEQVEQLLASTRKLRT